MTNRKRRIVDAAISRIDNDSGASEYLFHALA